MAFPDALPAAQSPGTFALPAIDSAIPLDISDSAHRSTLLARFALAAARCGVPLPKGRYASVEEVISAQWQEYLAEAHPQGLKGLAGAPIISITDDVLEVVIRAQQQLDVYQLKPVVEALERSEAGLGWYVHGVLDNCCAHGHEIYGMGHVAYWLDCFHSEMEEFTDEAYARSILEQNGEEPLDGEISPELMKQLRDDHGMWPSQVLAELNGHGHLLGCGWAGIPAPPKSLKSTSARAWLTGHPKHRHAQVVRLALELERAFKRDERAFTWNMNEDETEPLGASCFLVWDQPGLVMEAINHHEEMLYNGGQCVEAYARCRVPLEAGVEDQQLKQLAFNTKNYFARWAILGSLLAQFPIWKDDDEV